MGEEPRMVKEEQEVPPEQEAVVVATPYTPAPPSETKRLEEDGWLVVARPVYTTVEFEPPTRAPRLEVPVKGPLKARVVVATLESALVPFPYRSSEEVKVVLPVPPEETGRAVVKLAELAEMVPVAVRLASERSPETRALPCTESVCEGEVVPRPIKPERNALPILGSNQYSEVVVEVEPIATTSLALFG